jgi:hypothetical protein
MYTWSARIDHIDRLYQTICRVLLGNEPLVVEVKSYAMSDEWWFMISDLPDLNLYVLTVGIFELWVHYSNLYAVEKSVLLIIA